MRFAMDLASAESCSLSLYLAATRLILPYAASHIRGF